MMNRNLFNSLRAAFFVVVGLLGLLQLQSAQAFEGDLSGRNYDAQEARRYQRVRVGVIEDIRQTETVRANPQTGNLVAVGLGIIGAGAGQLVNDSRSRSAVTALLAAAGGLGGKMVGDYVARERKVMAEIVVTLTTGESFSIVQEVDQDTAMLQPGDRVRLMEGQNIRVVKIRQAQAGQQPSPYTY